MLGASATLWCMHASPGRSIRQHSRILPPPDASREGHHIEAPGCLTALQLQGHFYLENLTKRVVHSASEALEIYWQAMAGRFVAGHDMNQESSRAHTVFELCLTSAPVSARDEARHAKLTLVDLAGCEQQKHTGIGPALQPGMPQHASTTRATFAESTAINSSLMTLRQVIVARSSEAAGAKVPHVPYRESKLTALLKDSLSGSGRMLMLACLGPAVQHAEGNMHTLEYACMVRTSPPPPAVRRPTSLAPLGRADNLRRPRAGQNARHDCRRFSACVCPRSSSGRASRWG